MTVLAARVVLALLLLACMVVIGLGPAGMGPLAAVAQPAVHLFDRWAASAAEVLWP